MQKKIYLILNSVYTLGHLYKLQNEKNFYHIDT